MIETRAEINGLAKSKRIIAHGLFSPDLGKANLEEMHRQHEQLKPEAWKGYPGQPLADGSVGWWMDDEKVAYPFYEYSRKIGIKNICVHKGLPLPGWEIDHSSPKDVEKAAKDFPGYELPDLSRRASRAFAMRCPRFRIIFAPSRDVPWVSDLCAMRKRNPKMTNVYMDLGTTFGMTVITQPALCAYMLGLMIDAFGEDHVLVGHRFDLVGQPAMADRSVPPAADARRSPEAVRFQAAHRCGQGEDLRPEFGESLRHRREGKNKRDSRRLRNES